MMRRRIERVLQSKGMASLGDSLLNFALSVAKTRATGSPCGSRVENQLLVEAIQSVTAENYFPKRLKRHEKADLYEGLIAYAWLQGQLKLEDIIGTLHKSLGGRNLNGRLEERKAVLEGLQRLLELAESSAVEE